MAYRRKENHNARCRKQHRLMSGDVTRGPKILTGYTVFLRTIWHHQESCFRLPEGTDFGKSIKTHHSGFAFEMESQD